MVHASSDLTVLLTRPLNESLKMKGHLSQEGYRVFIDPLLDIRAVACEPPSLEKVQAFVTTSVHGIRRLAQLTSCRTIALYVVGEASLQEAQIQGFDSIFIAKGSVSSLIDLLREQLKPDQGRILYFSGQEIKADLVDMLTSQNYKSQRIIVYEARGAKTLKPETQEALVTSRLNAVFFFSPRTVAIFNHLTALYRPTFSHMTALCLSEEVAAALWHQDWHQIIIAPERSGRSMINSLKANFPLPISP